MTGSTMISEQKNRARAGMARLSVVGLAAALELGQSGRAAAFPLLDTTNQDPVPHGTELAAPDVHDLQHQLQIVNGLAAPAGGGWTFLPRIDLQEMMTDNVQQQHSPRQWDLVSYISPGFSLFGDLPRVQMSLNYAPTLSLYTEASGLNSLTQDLSGLATVTLVPETLFVDVRAVSGVHSIYGDLGGAGALGNPIGAGATAQSAIPAFAGDGLGLTRDNEVQTTSFGISPYLMQDFGDWGSARLGYSFNVTRSATLSGFASSPIPAGGANGQTLISNEENAHFVTGQIMQFLQNSVDLDVLTGTTTTDTNGALVPGIAVLNPNGTITGLSAPPGQSTSSRVLITDTISYALSRSLVLFASGGHEDIVYSNQVLSGVTPTVGANGALVPNFSFANVPGTSIHDMTWSFGGTWTPNPNSSLTLSYGHQNGFNSFSANGYYQATARTLLTASYGSTLGTQLEYVQNQLNLATNNGSGTLVNGLTRGGLFGANNALAYQNGVFRTDTFSLGSTTTLDRDIISLNLLFARQTASGTSSSTATSHGGSVYWLHQMQPDMIVSAGVSYSAQDQAAFTGVNANESTSFVGSLAWQYQISDTVSVNLRYSYLQRQSGTAAFDMYQNLLILGISKTF